MGKTRGNAGPPDLSCPWAGSVIIARGWDRLNAGKVWSRRGPSRGSKPRVRAQGGAAGYTSEERGSSSTIPSCGEKYEANLQAKHSTQEKNPWLQGADAYASGQGNHCSPPAKGPDQANSLVPLGRVLANERTLRSATEFQRVLRAGQAMSTPRLTVHTLRREDNLPGRHGFVVSRRHGGAVERNRVRRQARAALERAGGIPPGFDSVIAVRPDGRVEVARLTEELSQILEKIRRNDR